MKKVGLLLALIQIFIAYGISQPCLPEGIIFYSQQQIDDFQINYPGCTEIEGHVEINGPFVTNLDGLSVLIAIGGDLEIVSTNLQSLSGLQNIITIGGNFVIWQNMTLSSITSIENLNTVGGDFEVKNNPSLINLNGVENMLPGGYINIFNNNSLINIEAFHNLSLIEGGIYITGNDVLAGLNGLNNITHIEGFVYISNNQSLMSLDGLNNISSIGGGLMIFSNSILENLLGLESLNIIGEGLAIAGNNSLENLNGIQNLFSIAGLLVFDNNLVLTDITAIDSLDLESITELYIANNTNLNICNIKSICEYIANPTGSVIINENDSGCNSIEEVEEACLTDVEELENNNDQFNVYPNPANEILNIKQSNPNITYTIELRNLYGQLVKEEKNIQSSHYALNVADLKAGVYFYGIRDGDKDKVLQQGRVVVK